MTYEAIGNNIRNSSIEDTSSAIHAITTDNNSNVNLGTLYYCAEAGNSVEDIAAENNGTKTDDNTENTSIINSGATNASTMNDSTATAITAHDTAQYNSLNTTAGTNEQKRGYLLGDFALYHLKDMKNMSFEYHYHDFNKIIILISGVVTYIIEGKAYRLKPWDVLFVSRSEIHRPIIDSTAVYERIVIWVNSGFLELHSMKFDLFTCFMHTGTHISNLIRLEHVALQEMQYILFRLELSLKNEDFGYDVLRNSLIIQLLIMLTREQLKSSDGGGTDFTADETVQQILDHINANIKEDLSIEALSSKFYINRYHLMHKFKQQTGCSVHSYVSQKRLIKADELIKSGFPSYRACEMCGYDDYSSFVRAYKKLFGVPPKKRRVK